MYENQMVTEADAVRGGSHDFKLLTKEDFVYFFTPVCDELLRMIEMVKVEEVMLVDDTACQAMLAELKHLFVLLEVVVTITKKNDKQAILVYIVKSFGQFMTFFLGPCWGVLKQLLARFTSEIMVLIKIVQRCTRQIQSLCAHAKVTKDSSILTYVPKIKKQLEQMIYVIKETLKKEGAEDAFWLGNLKNRYLDGKEVTEEGDEKLQQKREKRATRSMKRVRSEVEKVVDDQAVEDTEDTDNSEWSVCCKQEKRSLELPAVVFVSRLLLPRPLRLLLLLLVVVDQTRS